MLTPLEIENKKFAKQMVNGYSVDEVDQFLDDLTEDYTKIYKENTEIKANLEELEEKVSRYKTIENTLQSTLVIAQKTAEDTKNVAREQADQIIKQAENEAKEAVEGLKTQIALKKQELEDTKKQFDVYKAKMEALLVSQVELLKGVNEEE